MRSLPLRKAGVGSAVNDTTRELGGALGVAVFGSILASHYRAAISADITGLPSAAGRSLGATLQTATALSGEQGQALADSARHAYAQAFDATLGLTVLVAIFAAGLVFWLLRPTASEPVTAGPAVDLEAAQPSR